MTTSFSVTRDQVIGASLGLLGVLQEGQPPSSQQLIDCALAMNVLLKTWADQGKKGWLYRNISFPWVIDREFWTIGPGGQVTPNRPQTVVDAWWENPTTGERQSMFMLERERFFKLSPKTQSSTAPTNWYYDAQITNGNWYAWPRPSIDTNSFYLSCQMPIEDILTGAAAVNVPQTWYRALIWNLADEVGLNYRPHPDVLDRIERKAPIFLAACSNLEEEQGSVYFQPNPMGNMGGFSGR